jgi:hypothetical protein
MNPIICCLSLHLVSSVLTTRSVVNPLSIKSVTTCKLLPDAAVSVDVPKGENFFIKFGVVLATILTETWFKVRTEMCDLSYQSHPGNNSRSQTNKN